MTDRQTEPMTVSITLRDGTRVVADVFTPDGSAAVPAVVEITPYRRRSALTCWNNQRFWTDRGYALVIVDTRGCGDSEGEFVLMRREGEDGHDIVEWIAAQTWCSGRIGLTGGSYSGTNQWLIARERPPHLACINPNSTVADFRNDLCYIGGALHLGWTLSWPLFVRKPDRTTAIDWSRVLHHRPLLTADEEIDGPDAVHREILAHPVDDAYWQALDLSDDDYRAIGIPSLALSGWYDTTLAGTISHFQRAARAHPGRGLHRLIVGAWNHDTARRGGFDRAGMVPKQRYGEIDIPASAILPALAITARFFDVHLKDFGRDDTPVVKVYVPGCDVWLIDDCYPPGGATETPLYLEAASPAVGSLTWQPPSKRSSNTFVHDPRHPVPSTIDGESLAGHPVDVSSLSLRNDVLLYQSDQLDRAVVLLGNVKLVLDVVVDAPDCDFVVRLLDCHPDGRAICLGSTSSGVARARFRRGHAKEVLLVPGEPTEIVVDLLDIAHRFAEGHRIQLQVSGSAFPFISVNPGTGNPIATDVAEPVKITQQILHGGNHPSRVLLPIIDLSERKAPPLYMSLD